MTYEEMQRFIQMSRGKSREELMDDLGATVREQQARGELSGSKMEEIYEMISPMLTPEQKRKMREVIERLRV
ncbi:MAG: hypothetical protein FWE69_05310 [Clostridiales bacterium]|nr:hypothetical protein [Clostridiales bacterium]